MLLVSRTLLIIYFMLISLFGTLLNCFVFYLVCKFKKLRSTLSIIVVVQIVLVNIIASSFLIPMSLASVLANQWLLGEHLCVVVGALRQFITISRTALMLGLVTDRFCSVIFVYSYPRYRVKVLYSFSIVTCTIALGVTVLVGVMDCFSFSNTTWICRMSSTCSDGCAVVRQVTGMTLFFPISIASVIMYSVLFHKGRRARKCMQQMASASDISNMNKEQRANITFFLMFLALFLLNIPPGLVSFVATVTSITSNAENSLWFYIVNTLTLNLFVLAHIADPIFILRNRDVREVVSELVFGCVPILKRDSAAANV